MAISFMTVLSIGFTIIIVAILIAVILIPLIWLFYKLYFWFFVYRKTPDELKGGKDYNENIKKDTRDNNSSNPAKRGDYIATNTTNTEQYGRGAREIKEYINNNPKSAFSSMEHKRKFRINE